MLYRIAAMIALLAWPTPGPAGQADKYWSESTASQISITSLTIGSTYDTVTARLSDLGPAPLYFASIVGQQKPLISVLGLYGNSWREISSGSDLRAACSVYLKAGESAETTAVIDHRLFLHGIAPEKIAAQITVYRNRSACKAMTAGSSIMSTAFDYNRQN